MDLHESAARSSENRGHRFVLARTARWAALNLAGGSLLFWVLPRVVGGDGLPASGVFAVVLAGVQVHHFFVDGVIWKLKSSAVSSPLLATVGDLLPPVPEKPPPLLEPAT